MTLLFSLTGCQNSDELIANATAELSDTYWTWKDTSPSESGVSIYKYAHIKEDGTLNYVGYTHHNGAYVSREVTYGEKEYEYTWEVIENGGKPYVKVTYMVKDYVNNFYFHVEINKDGQIESLSYNM